MIAEKIPVEDESPLLALNQAVQASHEILALMEEGQQQLSALLDNIPDVFAIIDEKGSLLEGNRFLVSLLGCDPEEYLNAEFFRLFSPAARMSFEAQLEKVTLGTETCLTTEFELPVDGAGHVEKAYQWFLKRLVFVEESGKCAVFVIGRDVSQLRAYQQELSLQRQLETLFAASRDMSSARTRLQVCQRFLVCMLSQVRVSADFSASAIFPDPEIDGAPRAELVLAARGQFYFEAEELKQLTEDPSWATRAKTNRRSFLDSDGMLVVPLFFDGTVIGTVRMGPCLEGGLGGEDHTPAPLKELTRDLSAFTDMLATSMAIALESVNFARRSAAKAKIESELAAIRMVHTALLPARLEFPGMELAATFLPAAQAGGDWFSFHYDSVRHRLYFYVGDVTGHGIPSALITGVGCGAIHAIGEVSSRYGKAIDENPTDHLLMVASVANRVIFETGKQDYLVTMNFVSLDLETGEGIFVNAGHTFPAIIRSATNTASLLCATGSPLGLSLEPKFEPKTFTLAENDIFFMYTDGLIENQGTSGEQLSIRELKRLMLATKNLKATQEALFSRLSGNWGSAGFADDVTTFSFSWKGPVSRELVSDLKK